MRRDGEYTLTTRPAAAEADAGAIDRSMARVVVEQPPQVEKAEQTQRKITAGGRARRIRRSLYDILSLPMRCVVSSLALAVVLGSLSNAWADPPEALARAKAHAEVGM